MGLDPGEMEWRPSIVVAFILSSYLSFDSISAFWDAKEKVIRPSPIFSLWIIYFIFESYPFSPQSQDT